MNKIKKSFRNILQISFAAVALFILANLSDSKLNLQTTEVLNSALSPNDLDEKKCAATLGLLVDPNLDSLAEGSKYLEKLKELSNEKVTHGNDISVPHKLDTVEPKERCNGLCHYSTEEKQRLKEALNKQQAYLSRFKGLMDMGDTQCHHPQVLIKLPILGIFRLAKHQVLEYKLLAQEGDLEEARNGLLKMNHFLEKTLLREKYTLVTGSIYASLLIDLRQTLLALPNPKGTVPKFEVLKYEELVKRIEVGELQAGEALLKPPLDYRFFELADINNTETTEPPAWNKLASALLNYFFLRKETLNANLETVRSSAWHPCIGQKDIPCQTESPNYLTWVRNPVGKSITYLLIENLPPFFQKFKNKIETLNQLATSKKENS